VKDNFNLLWCPIQPSPNNCHGHRQLSIEKIDKFPRTRLSSCCITIQRSLITTPYTVNRILPYCCNENQIWDMCIAEARKIARYLLPNSNKMQPYPLIPCGDLNFLRFKISDFEVLPKYFCTVRSHTPTCSLYLSLGFRLQNSRCTYRYCVFKL